MQNDTVTLENSLAASYKVKHTLTTAPRSLTPGIKLVSYKGNKNDVHRNTCMLMFTAAVFIITKKLATIKSSSIGKWINKL